jgi:hypothetical protein
LYTKDAEEDDKRMREAATQEAKRVEDEMKNTADKQSDKKVGLFDGDKKQAAKPTNVHIDVDSILRGPKRAGR